MSVELEVLTSWEQVVGRRADWSALLPRSSANEPTLSPLWLETWWRVFGHDGRAPRVVFLRRDGRLIGIAPLLVRPVRYRRAVPLRRIEFLASGEEQRDEIYSEYLNVIALAGREQEVARALVEALRTGALGPWDELSLDMMEVLSPMTQALMHELRRTRLLDGVASHQPCPYISLPDTWDEYLASLSSSRRYYLRRTVRTLEKWAGPELVVTRASTPEELTVGIDILIDLHGERWRSQGRDGVFTSERFQRFHREVMPGLWADGHLDLFWLSKGSRALAAVYNIVWDDKVYFYQSGRTPDVPNNVRPGIALHVYAIQHAIRCGRRKYDFLAGATSYKQRMATAQETLIHLKASNPRSPAIRMRNLGRRGGVVARALRRRLHDVLPERSE
ncbi:GNAT family N-acetyltransferase [Haliangium sp.]|uniref:GNAT family N-acetyltransferase n=1 Tax=Haliangium sp. TaxID=2663208 RepID=UPI003D1063DC